MKTAERLLRQALGFAVFLLMVAMTVLMFCQSVDRYLIGSGFSAYDQLAKIGMVWLSFIGLPLVLLHRENISADLIRNVLSPRILSLRDLTFDIMIGIMAVMILWYGLPVMRIGAFQDIIGTPFTYWSIYLALNVSMALTALIAFARIGVKSRAIATSQDPK